MKDYFELMEEFENCLEKGDIDKAKEIESYAKEKGIELEVKKESLQRGFEHRLEKSF
jgi:hypothetical protein